MIIIFSLSYLLFLALYMLATVGLGYYESRYSLVEDPIHRWTRWIRISMLGISGLSLIFFIILLTRI